MYRQQNTQAGVPHLRDSFIVAKVGHRTNARSIFPAKQRNLSTLIRLSSIFITVPPLSALSVVVGTLPRPTNEKIEEECSNSPQPANASAKNSSSKTPTGSSRRTSALVSSAATAPANPPSSKSSAASKPSTTASSPASKA